MTWTKSSIFLMEFPWTESDKVASRIARKIRRSLRRFPCGFLEDVAAHFRVRIRWDDSGSDASMYIAPLSEGDWAEIMLSTSLSVGQRWRAFIHELAHHLMHTWVAPLMYSSECVVLLGNPDCAPLRHAIARRVEVLVIGSKLVTP
ncbi:hypothetical protein [Armatimonas sp.]|uniref:hypothetical protein n=1 Tax=Armatimonas sp. TaxID=1872638 RepID=UPI00286B3336|nr:hypothetical protein [Armatimonas sp.]